MNWIKKYMKFQHSSEEIKMIDYYNPYFLVSTFLGLGKIFKKGAGTIGSIVSFPISFFIFKYSLSIYEFLFDEQAKLSDGCIISLAIILLLTLLGGFCSNKYSKAINNNDPKEVIIDEICGQSFVTILTVPFTYTFLRVSTHGALPLNFYECFVLSCLAGLAIFRIFDILKPWPINYIEKKFKGGLGIMIDDIAAALISVVFYYFILFYVIIDRLIN